MFLLDTNAVSGLRRPDKASKKILAWSSSTPMNQTYLSAITVMELELGVLLIERKDQAQGKILRTWLDRQILPLFETRILAIDTAIARRCAQLHVPNPRSERDSLIAATALEHGMTIVTRNVAGFALTGASILSPWD